ncbi:hypothetical protein [Natrinema salinisoli]|uniref:hypothetical protein n=1 Tax=Natrinema salinisoli TaxID=2878535 RepID=UPI001CF0582F|nr:hypothetical protein [Natrinema salinisoli]
MRSTENAPFDHGDQSPGSDISNRFLALIGGIVLLFLLLVAGIWYSSWRGGNPSQPRLNLEALGIAINIILSGSLIYIYGQMARTQEEERNLLARQANINAQQTDIQSEQSSIMKLAYDPLVLDEGWTLDEGDLTVTLSNVGNGVAKNLRIRPILVPLDTNQNLSDVYALFMPRSLHRVHNYAGEMVKEQSFRRLEGGILRANEVGEPFEPTTFSPILEVIIGLSQANTRSFSGLLSELQEDGYHYALCQLVLRYENGIDETKSESLTTAIFELDSVTTAEEVFTKTGAEVPYSDILIDEDIIDQSAIDTNNLKDEGINPEYYLK